MNIQNNRFPSIEQMRGQLLTSAESKSVKEIQNSSIPSFQEILENKQTSSELKFSKHANERLASRNIDLSETQIKRLEDGAKRACEKGIQESLVMVDNLAFIVNVKNNTVVTAVNDSDDKVFTNIDGAVII